VSEMWPSLEDEARLREWVREAAPSGAPALAADLPALYAHYGLQNESGFYSTERVREHLRTLTLKAIPRGETIGLFDLSRLQRHLLFRHVLDGDELHPVYRVVETLQALTQQEKGRFAAGFEAGAAWKEAIRLCLEYLAFGGTADQVDDATFRRLQVRNFNIAEAAGRLRAAGMSLAVEAGHIRPAEGELERFGARLHSIVQELGGLAVSARLLDTMAPHFDPSLGRYHLVRTRPSVPQDLPLQVPFGYLLNLAAREAHAPAPRKLPSSEANARWAALINGATDLTAILDVQPYTIYEGMFMGPEQLTRRLQQEALYDSAFTLVQLRPSDVGAMLRGLFGWIDDDAVRPRLGWTPSGAIEVAECILRLATPPQGLSFRAPDVAGRIRHRSKGEVRNILLALSHPPGTVNEGYLLPTHGDRVNFGFRPFVRRHDDSYVLVSPSWCGPAFYEAIAAALRSAGVPQVEQRVGEATEAFVRAVLAQHGVPSRSGEYTDAEGEVGECDAAIEATADVVFLEMKGKALTRASRAGGIPQLMVDIAASLLKAQAQAGGHEVRIRRDGHLHLRHKREGEYRLELRGREVERVALTLLEYGTFQDRFLCQQIVGAIVNAVITVNDKEWEKRFRGFFDAQEDLREQVRTLRAQAGGDLGPNLFMNVGFLSLPQLLVLIDGVNSPDTFHQALMFNRNVTMGSGDFYFELSQLRRLKAHQPQTTQ